MDSYTPVIDKNDQKQMRISASLGLICQNVMLKQLK